MSEDTIALVWSFTNDNKDIPYRITRIGKTKKEGGTGVKYACNCPSFTHRGGKICKHLILFREKIKNKSISFDQKFTITDIGMEILKI